MSYFEQEGSTSGATTQDNFEEEGSTSEATTQTIFEEVEVLHRLVFSALWFNLFGFF